MFDNRKQNRIRLSLGLIILAVAFVLDATFPLGPVMGAIYVLVSLCALGTSPSNAIVLAAVATATNVIGYCLAPTVEIPEWMVATNRVFAILTTWLLIFVGLRLRQQFQSMIAQVQRNHERHRLAVEGADLGFWDENISTGQTIVDKRWVACLGYPPADSEWLTTAYDELIHPDDRNRVVTERSKYLSGQSDRFEVEHRVKAKDGAWRWVLTKGRVISRDGAGRPLRAAGTHLDVTRTRELERQAEQVLRDRTEELRMLTDAMPMMISYLSSDQRIQFNNFAFERISGLTSEQIKGKHLREVVGVEAYERVQPYIETTLRGTRVHFEEQITTMDGAYWWLIHFLPRVNTNGAALGFYALITDITDLKQSEEQINQQREALSIYNRRSAANEMAAALAHELNQPLATITVYAGRLREIIDHESHLSTTLSTTLNIIHDQALRAGQIVRQVRSLVDRRSIRRTVIDVRSLVESVKRMCEVQTLPDRIPIDIRIDEDVDSIVADWLQLQQLLVNLVTNAMEASIDVSASRKRVTIAVSSQLEGIRLSIVDRGQGLTSEELDRVFEPYYTTKADGLGIGLNICQSIVSAHGGRIWAAPNQAAGATFHVLLPVDCGADDPATPRNPNCDYKDNPSQDRASAVRPSKQHSVASQP
jgi:PAS domain S-box-containing protein